MLLEIGHITEGRHTEGRTLWSVPCEVVGTFNDGEWILPLLV